MFDVNNIKNGNTACVVAGNGPSLAKIDYERLPLKFDAFRCNQFYFEDKYYLGKKVKFAFATSPILFEQSYTYKNIASRMEYEIDNIVVSDFNLHIDKFYQIHEVFFKDIIRGSSHLSKLSDFFDFIRHNETNSNKRITSGIYMCAFAVALGYREIYITGIDLYKTNEPYAFDSMKSNLLAINPGFKTIPNTFHSAETDVEALQFLIDKYDAKFYSLCKDSPMTNHIPLAKCKNEFMMQPKNRSEDSIKDMLIPSQSAYEQLNDGIELTLHRYPPKPISLEEESKTVEEEYLDTLKKHIHLSKSYIKNNKAYKAFNNVFMFLKDIIHLPRDIRRFIQADKLEKEVIKKCDTGGGGGEPHLIAKWELGYKT